MLWVGKVQIGTKWVMFGMVYVGTVQVRYNTVGTVLVPYGLLSVQYIVQYVYGTCTVSVRYIRFRSGLVRSGWYNTGLER